MRAMRARTWWVLALRSVAAVLVGILALVWPGLTLLALITVFGAYALLDGLVAVITSSASRGEHQHWWAALLEGIAGIMLGVLTFLWPGMTALVVRYFIATWAVLTGVFEIVAAIQLRRVITGEWIMILGGIASIVFGLLLVLFPGAGAVGLTWMIGAYAIVFGILLIVLAFRLRSLGREVQAVDASCARRT